MSVILLYMLICYIATYDNITLYSESNWASDLWQYPMFPPEFESNL